MKKIAMLMVVGLLAGIFLVTSTAIAQEPLYKVQTNDNLWNLSATYLGDPLKWVTKVLDANPFLKEKGRMFRHHDGRMIVLIRPGEELAGLERIGVKAELIPFSSLWPALVPAQASVSTDSVSSPAPAEANAVPFYRVLFLGMPLWQMVVMLLIALSILYALYKFFYGTYRDGRIFYRNPATAGAPIVQGGIPPSQSAMIENRFERIAERHYGERNPSADLSVDRPQRISEILHGFLSGSGQVQYRDRTETRRLNHEPAYSARFRFPDGTEETLYFLEACANDVVFRNVRYNGFIWELERMIVPVPKPQPVLAAVVSASTPLRVVKSVEPAVALTTVIVGSIQMTVPEGSSVRLGQDGKIVISVSTACEMTMAPAAAEQAAATETKAS